MGKRDKKKKDPEKRAMQRAAKEAKADRKAAKRLAKEDARERGEGRSVVERKSEDAASASAAPKASKKERRDKKKREEEDDLDSILASYAKRTNELTAPVVEVLDGPWPAPPRGNFTLTAVPGGELIMFGGEYYDGVENVVFDEVWRWDPDGRRGGTAAGGGGGDDGAAGAGGGEAATEGAEEGRTSEEEEEEEEDDDDKDDEDEGGEPDASKCGVWRRVLSPPPTPPARCSHAAVCHNGSLYVFGGELATADRYHHYRDLWRFDLKANVWEEIVPRGSSHPAARSGHRMAAWRHYLILFGGFYEALRETRWYDDLWAYDFQTNQWTAMSYSKLATTPPARSAFNFGLFPGADTAYLYGGFSKLKNPAPGTKAEGRVHTDCWALNLKGIPSGRLPTWDRVSRRGEYPSIRSGTGCLTHKNRLLVYGGVQDTEGDHHAVKSVFYDDLFAFDMERRRWFRVGMKKAAGGGGRRRKKKGGGDDDAAQDEARAKEGHGEEERSSSDEEAHPEGEATSSGWDLDMLRSNMFAFIDGDGNIVYEKIEDEEEEEKKEGKEEEEKGKDEGYEADREKADNGEDEKEEDDDDDGKEEDDKAAEPTLEREVPVKDASDSAKPPPQSAPPNHPPGAISRSSVMNVSSSSGAPTAVARSSPLPRINPALAVRGNVLYVMGGLLEVGDREVTLDDCWALDLNRRERWECVWAGSMHRQVWRGVQSDEEGSYVSAGMDEDEYENDEEDDSDEEYDELPGEERLDPEEEARRRAERRAAKRAAGKEKRRGVRDEIAALRERYDLDDTERTPAPGETVADFYGRTSRRWEMEAAERIKAAGGGGGSEEDAAAAGAGGGGAEGGGAPASAEAEAGAASNSATAGAEVNEARKNPYAPLRSASSNLEPDLSDLSAKELKREGFRLARARYDELRPALEWLAELEAQQADAEGEGGGGGGGGKGRREGDRKRGDKERKKDKKDKKENKKERRRK